MNKNTAKAVAFGLVLGLVLPFAGLLRAEDGHMNMDPAKRLEMLTKQYTLTADQQAQTKKLLDDRKQKVDAAKQAMEAAKKDMDAARDAFHSQFRELLTADQQKAWDADKAKEKMEHKDKKEMGEKKMEMKDKK